MKKETAEQKLNAALGLTQKAVEVRAKSTGRVVGITEDEIQEFRDVQGLLYFLEAPELFSHKICKHCKEDFYVSRKYVAFCSYTCIKKELETQGVKWSKAHDIEALVLDIYDGNEPLWLRKRVLQKLQEMVKSPPKTNYVPDTEKQKHPFEPLPEENEPSVTSSPVTKSDALAALGLGPTSGQKSPRLSPSSSSSVTSTTSTSTSGGKNTSNRSGTSRRIISAH